MPTGESDSIDFVDRLGRRIEASGFVLREVLHHDLMAFAPLAGVGRFGARQHPHQRRLAGAVGRDERDPVAALDVQVDAIEHDVVAVRLARVVELEHHAAALRARRET